MSLGGPETRPLLDRVSKHMDDAARAVTAFWGADWPRDIIIVATASDEQFRALAGGGSDIAAATTGQRIVFAPGAATMSDERCELCCATSFSTMPPVPRPRWTHLAG